MNSAYRKSMELGEQATTDISNNEALQSAGLTVAIYEVHEAAIGLVQLPGISSLLLRIVC